MPRVGYALPMQGFRPRTNPLGALAGLGISGLGAESDACTDAWHKYHAAHARRDCIAKHEHFMDAHPELAGTKEGWPAFVAHYPDCGSYDVWADFLGSHPGCAGPRRGPRMSGLGDGNTFSGCTSAVDGNGNPVSCNDPTAAVWFDANMNAVPAGTQPAAAAPSFPSAGVPTGSFIKYTGQWQTTAGGSGTQGSALTGQSADNIMHAVTAALASDGLPVMQASNDAGAKAAVFGSFGVKFNVTLVMQVTGPGFAQASDAASIVNHEVYAVTGLMPVSSNVLVSSTGPGGSTTGTPPPGLTQNPAGTPASFTAWLEQNAMWIGVGLVAAFVLPAVVKKL